MTTDAPASGSAQQSEGPHPTLAGSAADPNVTTDSKMGSVPGAGGTENSQVMAGGVEHIKNSEMGSEAAVRPMQSSKPPASNPGADDASGGIPAGQGGLSSTANIGSPVPNTGEDRKTIIGTLKEYLGFGKIGEREASNAVPATAVDRATQTSNDATETTQSASEQGITAAGAAAGGVAAAGAAAAGAVGAEPTKEKLDQTATTAQQTTGNAEPTTSKDVTMDDADKKDTTTSGENEPKPPAPAGTDVKTGAKAENRSAIPTAGGERLGEKHWGESKIVPDNPKPKEETGVSSAEGQPTDEVKANTAKNTGDHKLHGKRGEEKKEKEKLLDKIKQKLHIGEQRGNQSKS